MVWQYGHVTIPRHLRDIVITEYGVADLRAQTDSEVIKRLLAFGTDFTEDELKMLGALEKLKNATKNPLELVELAFRGLFQDQKVPQDYLERLGLDEASGLRQTLLRHLFIGSV